MKSTLRVVYILLVTAIGLLYLYQQSVTAYWQQTYHSDPPLHGYTDNVYAQFGPMLTTKLTSADFIVNKVIKVLSDDIAITTENKPTIVANNSNDIDNSLVIDNTDLGQGNTATVIDEQLPLVNMLELVKGSTSAAINVLVSQLETKSKNDPNTVKASNPPKNIDSSGKGANNTSSTGDGDNKVFGIKFFSGNDKTPISLDNINKALSLLPIKLYSNDRVFFAGDSLMQGVAPHVKRSLFQRYKIESIDLSKQSTGLAYPNAFNWPKTIKNTLDSDSSIKLLVIFLGPNDPWDFPVAGYSKYAKFKSALWEEQYRLRIREVIKIAVDHKVKILWLGVPCMRKTSLNNGVAYLNTLYQSEVQSAGQHFLDTKGLLGCQNDKYANFVTTDNGNIKVRFDDGIHFTIAGQRILAKAIFEKIIVQKVDNSSKED